MKRLAPPSFRFCAAALAALLSLCPLSGATAQDQAPPSQGTSRGENFSAGKAPAQLFASDCTGSGCHKGPQGLAKNGIGLASFLREHYTNSRESAAALAGYLSRLPDAREARTPPRPGKPAAPASGSANWGEALGIPNEPRPSPNEARAPRQPPAGRTSRAAARPEDDPAATPPVHAPPAQRGRQPAATAAAPSPPPEPEAAPAPAPPPQQWDIFD